MRVKVFGIVFPEQIFQYWLKQTFFSHFGHTYPVKKSLNILHVHVTCIHVCSIQNYIQK